MTDYLEELLKKAEELLEENGGGDALSLHGVRVSAFAPEERPTRRAEGDAAVAAGARFQRGEEALGAIGWEREATPPFLRARQGREGPLTVGEEGPPFWEGGAGRAAAHPQFWKGTYGAERAGHAPEERQTGGLGRLPWWDEGEGGRIAAAFLPRRAKVIQAAREFRNEGGARYAGGLSEVETGRARAPEAQDRRAAVAVEGQEQSAEGVDRQFQRDARRYDGAFFLY